MGEALPRLCSRMEVVFRGGKIQRGGLEGAGEGGGVLRRRDAAEPAFPKPLQPGRDMGRDRQTDKPRWTESRGGGM